MRTTPAHRREASCRSPETVRRAPARTVRPLGAETRNGAGCRREQQMRSAGARSRCGARWITRSRPRGSSSRAAPAAALVVRRDRVLMTFTIAVRRPRGEEAPPPPRPGRNVGIGPPGGDRRGATGTATSMPSGASRGSCGEHMGTSQRRRRRADTKCGMRPRPGRPRGAHGTPASPPPEPRRSKPRGGSSPTRAQSPGPPSPLSRGRCEGRAASPSHAAPRAPTRSAGHLVRAGRMAPVATARRRAEQLPPSRRRRVCVPTDAARADETAATPSRPRSDTRRR